MYYPLDTKGNKKNVSESIRTIVHELLHMMLHYYYEDYIKEKGISNSQFHHLKEAQTVILNDIYSSILPKPDK